MKTPLGALATRLAVAGPEGLSDAELLALVCALPVAEAQRLLDGEPPARGRGARPLLKWQALLALHRRRERAPLVERPVLSSARAAAEVLSGELAHLEVEELHVLALDTRNRLIRRHVVARGGVNQVTVTAREVYRPLLVAGAARAIVAHNHPSGEPSPSDEDRRLTARLAQAGELLGVALLDHIIVAASGYYSFAEEGGCGAAQLSLG